MWRHGGNIGKAIPDFIQYTTSNNDVELNARNNLNNQLIISIRHSIYESFYKAQDFTQNSVACFLAFQY